MEINQQLNGQRTEAGNPWMSNFVLREVEYLPAPGPTEEPKQ